jgi:hypothetical protein
MSAPEQEEGAQREDEQFAAYMRQHFGVEPGAQAPLSNESAEPGEDEQFAAYMDRHFPAWRSGR